MTKCTYSALRQKEVINLCDGRRLGFVCDMEFDLCDGKITAIVVPGDSGFFGLGRCTATVIPWEKIETIGSDAILVRAEHIPCCPAHEEEGRRKHGKWLG